MGRESGTGRGHRPPGISWAGREKRKLQPGMESWARGASEGKLRKSEMGTDSEVLWVWGVWMR